MLTIFILESESDMVSPIRDLPEMKILKYQYYQPLKDVFAKFFINQQWVSDDGCAVYGVIVDSNYLF